MSQINNRLLEVNDQTQRIRTIIAGVFAFLLIFSYLNNIKTRSHITQKAEVRAQQKTTLITKKATNFYNKPGFDNKALGSIQQGVRFEILGQAFGSFWYKVNINGKEVWLAGQDIKVNY